MRILGNGDVTFILLSGIATRSSIRLSDNVELQPADTSHLDLKTALATCSHPDDIAVVAAFIPRTTAQFRITAKTPERLAVVAWNSTWDALLLSAVFRADVGFNLQSDASSSEITVDSALHATNHHMRGLSNNPPHMITSDEADWITAHFDDARQMLENGSFETAVHCLSTYRWHSLPRIRLAVLWAGIEALFGVNTEVVFRVSLYIARFLHSDDSDERKRAFESARRLYKRRSAAVHGSKIKGDSAKAVEESAEVLRKLLIRCIEVRSLPDESILIP